MNLQINMAEPVNNSRFNALRPYILYSMYIHTPNFTP